MTMPEPGTTSDFVLFDVHVHIYDCFDLQVFFDSAIGNFANEIANYDGSAQFQTVLILTDWLKENWFKRLVDLADQRTGPGSHTIKTWTFHRTKEPISLIARREDGERLLIVAGRKIISAENLEVLALATCVAIEDGLPLRNVLDQIKQNDAIPVIPWAVGKWMGKRGRVIKELLESTSEPDFFLCDNGNRPRLWPRPSFLALAEKKGGRVLAGSDPLHFASEATRAGSFANTMPGTIDPDTPAHDLKALLHDPRTGIRTYGRLERLAPFLRNQFAMQLLKRKNKQQLTGA
jgi:hypothetical protein